MTTPKIPIVFIHGLWLHATSWGPWIELFEEAGYQATAPGWPGVPDTVAQAREHPELQAGTGIADAVGHYARIVGSAKPIVISLTAAQFRYAFGNALTERESAELYDAWTIPAPGRPLFEAAFANFTPRSPAKVNTRNSARGPLLLISGLMDHTVPDSVTHATFSQYRRSTAVTDLRRLAGRGHSHTIDSGWRGVADTALNWLNAHKP